MTTNPRRDLWLGTSRTTQPFRTRDFNPSAGKVFYLIGQGLLALLLVGAVLGDLSTNFGVLLGVLSVALSGFYIALRTS